MSAFQSNTSLKISNFCPMLHFSPNRLFAAKSLSVGLLGIFEQLNRPLFLSLISLKTFYKTNIMDFPFFSSCTFVIMKGNFRHLKFYLL